jgi:hypothetical protein
VRTLKTVRLMRLIKLLRLQRLLSMFKTYQEFMSTYMSVVAALLGILFLAHVLSCFYYLVGTYDQYLHGGHLVEGWVTRQPGWGHLPSKPSASLGTRYITALVFALTFAGCETDAEKVMGVVSSLAVGVIFGAIAGIMTQIAGMVSDNNKDASLKIKALGDWMRRQHIPSTHQAQVREYFSELWMSQSILSEADIVAQLPPGMHGQICRILYIEFVATAPMFKGLAQTVLDALCKEMEPCMACKDQIIMHEGDAGEEMYFITDGEVEVTRLDRATSTPHRLGFLSKGAFFGEAAVVSGAATGCEVRLRTITAITLCQLCYLTREAVQRLQHQFKELHVRLLRWASPGRMGRLHSSQ